MTEQMIDEIVDTFVKDDAPKWVRDAVRKEVRKYYISNVHEEKPKFNLKELLDWKPDPNSDLTLYPFSLR